jgi:hypothetical protein
MDRDDDDPVESDSHRIRRLEEELRIANPSARAV